MAIYRIKSKLFTRAEKELIKQIWRKTNGLRGLPKGITSLEDARALKKLSKQLNSEESVKVTPEIRKALDNLGFTKATEDTINRMKSKYSTSNGDAYHRLSRLQTHRRQDPNFRELESKRLDKKFQAELRRSESTLGEHEKLSLSAKQDNSAGVVDPSLARFYRKKLNGSVIKIKDPQGACSASKLRGNKITEEGLREISDFPIKGKDLKGFNRPGGEMIAISDDTPRSIVLHEMGHNKSAREFKDPERKLWKGEHSNTIMNDNYGIPGIIEENMASANALNVLKNQKGVEKDKKRLDSALSSYTLFLKRRLGR